MIVARVGFGVFWLFFLVGSKFSELCPGMIS